MKLALILALAISTIATNSASTWGQSVRIKNGGICGSGWTAGHSDDHTFYISNAHVVGTKIGHEVSIQLPTQTVTGTVLVAAYSSTKMTDWAILKSPRVDSKALPLSTTSPTSPTHSTAGAPWCIWPLVSSTLTTVSLPREGQPWLWTPNSIGGQSGSPVYRDGTAFGLLTWSWNGRGAGQTTAAIWTQHTAKNSELAEVRPIGMTEVPTGTRAETSDGHYALADHGDLPIWSMPPTLPPVLPPPRPPVVPPALPPGWLDPGRIDRLIRLVELILRIIGEFRGLALDLTGAPAE